MIQTIVRYMQNKLDAETIFQRNYGLTELIERDGRVFPLFYETDGKYKLDFQPNKWFGVSYFRKNGNVSFADGSFPSLKPCEVPVTVTVPLKFICSIKKSFLYKELLSLSCIFFLLILPISTFDLIILLLVFSGVRFFGRNLHLLASILLGRCRRSEIASFKKLGFLKTIIIHLGIL